jgi:hypothetical protein
MQWILPPAVPNEWIGQNDRLWNLLYLIGVFLSRPRISVPWYGNSCSGPVDQWTSGPVHIAVFQAVKTKYMLLSNVCISPFASCYVIFTGAEAKEMQLKRKMWLLSVLAVSVAFIDVSVAKYFRNFRSSILWIIQGIFVAEIKLVPLLIFIYDARTHVYQIQGIFVAEIFKFSVLLD